jgi:hypothetical protein
MDTRYQPLLKIFVATWPQIPVKMRHNLAKILLLLLFNAMINSAIKYYLLVRRSWLSLVTGGLEPSLVAFTPLNKVRSHCETTRPLWLPTVHPFNTSSVYKHMSNTFERVASLANKRIHMYDTHANGYRFRI